MQAPTRRKLTGIEKRRLKRTHAKLQRAQKKVAPYAPPSERKLKAVAKKLAWLARKDINKMKPEAQRAAGRLMNSRLAKEALLAQREREYLSMAKAVFRTAAATIKRDAASVLKC
jgi:hypothetical protein